LVLNGKARRAALSRKIQSKRWPVVCGKGGAKESVEWKTKREERKTTAPSLKSSEKKEKGKSPRIRSKEKQRRALRAREGKDQACVDVKVKGFGLRGGRTCQEDSAGSRGESSADKGTVPWDQIPGGKPSLKEKTGVRYSALPGRDDKKKTQNTRSGN